MINRNATGATVEVTFELPAAVDADSAVVCGDFNDWSITANPLTRGVDGRLRTTVDLDTGRRWRFRYLLDGTRWENDWAADDYEPNGYGGQDSVVDLTGVSATEHAGGGRRGTGAGPEPGPAVVPSVPLAHHRHARDHTPAATATDRADGDQGDDGPGQRRDRADEPIG